MLCSDRPLSHSSPHETRHSTSADLPSFLSSSALSHSLSRASIMSSGPVDVASKRAQTEAALNAVRNRAAVPPPTIDFTVHVGDDGQTFNTTERVVKEVQAPAFFKPTDEQFYHDETRTKPDIAFLKNHFYREGRLTDEQVSFVDSRWGVRRCWAQGVLEARRVGAGASRWC